MPPSLKALILLNVGVFFVQFLGYPLVSMLGLIPDRVVQWPLPEFWRLVTYLFLHGGVWHLLFNLFALWMFGMAVESEWGGREFLKYYFLCGLGAALTSVALAPHSPIPIIGASGPIYGLLVAFAMLYPDAVVYLYFLIPVKAAHMAILFGALEFFMGASNATPGVARFAHLGGMATGYLYIRWWWVWKLKLKTFFKNFFSGDEEDEEAAPRARPARRAARNMPPAQEADDMAEVDRILDKILDSGLESLTDGEKATMHRYSARNKPS